MAQQPHERGYLHPHSDVLLLRVEYYDVGRVDLQGGNSRPLWKSPPSAEAKLCHWEFGSSMKVKYLGFVCGLKLGRQLDWRLR